MNRNGLSQSRFNGALNPGMVQRGMFTGKMDATFRRNDLLVQQGLLFRIEEGKGTAGEFIIVPHPGGADLEFVFDLWMNLSHVL